MILKGIRKFFAPDGGGSAAPAAPPAGAPAAPAAPAAAAPGGPAGAAPAAPSGQPPAGVKPGAFGLPAINPKDLLGKGGKTPEPGAGGGDKPDAWLDTPYTQPLMNRHKTPRETLDALVRSEGEAKRLDAGIKDLQKRHQSELANRDAKLTAMQKELEVARATPAFRELSADEEAVLATENPGGYAKYLVEKNNRQRDAATRQVETERREQEHKEHVARVHADIDRRINEMRADTKEFPYFNELEEAMDGIIEASRTIRDGEGRMLSPLVGHSWTPELLYQAAMGRAYLQALKHGAAVKDDGAEAARLQAEAAARAAGAPAGAGGAGGAGEGGADAAAKADKAYKDSIRSAGENHRFLTGGGRSS